MTTDRARLGRLAEEAAEQFLANQGLEPVTRNHRCRRGEIDLIMLDDLTLVFIEVRYRGPRGLTDGAGSITATKRTRITHAATHFLSRHRRFGQHCCRFDVVSVTRRNYRSPTPGDFSCSWIRDAFDT